MGHAGCHRWSDSAARRWLWHSCDGGALLAAGTAASGGCDQFCPASRLSRLAGCSAASGLWYRSSLRVRYRPGARHCSRRSEGIRSRTRDLWKRMNRVRTCWGIYREPAHSPGRIDDDRAILERVGEALVARGFDVKLVSADAEFDTDFANIFAMCERGPILDRLRGAEKTGSIVVNSPDAIRNTYRHRMVE